MAVKKKSKDWLEEQEDAQRLELLRSSLCCLLSPEEASRTLNQMKRHLGSFANMVRTSEEALAALPEVSQETARYLRMTLELAKAMMYTAPSRMQAGLLYEDYVELLRSALFGRKTEAVAVVLTDSAGRRLYSGVAADGQISAVRMNVRGLTTLCVNYSASYAVLGHNHPTGVALPSTEDIVVTAQVAQALLSVDVNLRDHIILTDNDTFSFAGGGILQRLNELAIRTRERTLREAREIAAEYYGGRSLFFDGEDGEDEEDGEMDHEGDF